MVLHDGLTTGIDMMRILIVEDDACHARMVSLALREAGITHTSHADDVASALTMLADCDMAVVDIGLPFGDGTDLIHPCEELGLPMVFMSGQPVDVLASLSLDSGFPAIEKTEAGMAQLVALINAHDMRQRADSRLARLTAMEGVT